MGAASHTPGPWHSGKSKVNHYVATRCGDVVCRLEGSAISPIDARVAADARLIAAAPDLLEALRSMLEDDDHDEAKRKARAAIAKATGEGL
jgi:hypothetical protein